MRGLRTVQSQATDAALYTLPLTRRGQVWRFATAFAISVAVWVPAARVEAEHARVLLWIDLTLGAASFVLAGFRRRWPFTVALLVTAIGGLSASSAGPGLLVGVSLATRRVVWQIVVVGIVAVAGSGVLWLVQPDNGDTQWWLELSLGALVTAAMLGWGLYIGSRRELIWSLQDRARRAEAEQDLRVSQGRSTERARIAREMHDVLAHRITLITMYAGALAYRTDLPPEQVRGSAELIQSTSQQALADLRQVLGVLRDDTAGAAELRERPQPTFRDLPALVQEAQDSGMRVHYRDQVVDGGQMPEQLGRTAYRIVQEGLTNARKHAPGATVLAALSGSPLDGVQIMIRNPTRAALAPGNAWTGPEGRHEIDTAATGSGLGLVGMRERAALSGGTLDSGRDGDSFELRVWLPWTAR